MLPRLKKKPPEHHLVVVDTPAAALPPSPEAIEAELEKILRSPQFARSERLSRFLRYIVEQALGGHSDRLKEYTLGAEVYGRGPSFDPQADSIVRVEAARLRAKLEEYYQAGGQSDPTQIIVPKRGYAPIFVARGPVPVPEPPPRPRRPLRRVALAGLLSVLAGIGAFVGFKRGRSRDVTPTTVAVLPLAHLCPDKEHDFFSDGLTEELIEELAHVPGLRVVSRTSSFYFKGKTDDVRKIGRQLDVSTVLEGSVRQTGDRLRITVQLIGVADGYRLWSETYDRDFSDLFATQREIAAGVASALRLRLAGGPAGPQLQRRPHKLEAYNQYLRGRYFSRKWTTESLQKALDCYDRAVRLEPEFARAHAELAETQCVLGIHAGLAPGEVMPKAKAAAQRALALDNRLGDAHAAMGLVRAVYEWDWKGAAQEFERAHTLDPEDPDVHEAWVMGYLAPTGRLDEALKQIHEAQVFDPVSPRIFSVAGMVHYFARRYDESIEQLHKALELDASFYAAYLALGSAYEQKSAFDEAIGALQRGEAAWHSGMGAAFLGHTYALMGRRTEAEAAAAELARLSSRRYVSPAYVAAIYAALGQNGRALDWLEKAYQQRSATLAYLKVNPRYAGLRSEPRFIDLLNRIHLQ